jgi:hypothetical protein
MRYVDWHTSSACHIRYRTISLYRHKPSAWHMRYRIIGLVLRFYLAISLISSLSSSCSSTSFPACVLVVRSLSSSLSKSSSSSSCGSNAFSTRATSYPIAYPVLRVIMSVSQAPRRPSSSMAGQSRKLPEVNHCETRMVPSPKDPAIAMMKRARRSIPCAVITVGEQKRRHPTEDWLRNTREESTDLSKDTVDKHPEPTGIASISGSDIRERDNTNVLRKRCTGQNHAQSRKETVDRVSKETTFHRLIVALTNFIIAGPES